MNENWYVILNPRAGSGKTMSEWLPAEKKMKKLGIGFTLAYTNYAGHAVDLARDAAAQGYRKILAVGGDGSLHEVFTGIMRYCDATMTPPEEFYMGVAPIGSGNDWIKSLGVENDVESVLKLIQKNSFGKMDVIKLSSYGAISYMANIGGVGFDSHVCERANLQKSYGWRNKMLYLRALRYTMFHTRAINVKILSDSEVFFEGKCYSIALGNGKYSGGGMRQVPKADINDGLLDAMVVPKLPLLSLMKEIPRLFCGNLDKSDKILFTRCKELQIIPLDERSRDIIEVDGEIEGRLPVTISVTGKRINVIKGLSKI